jgi:radical SAM protein with 4Fe4S-binding SPASM domain
MECPHIPRIGYGEFGKRLRQKIAGKRVPLGGSLELTFRCNLRCAHCYIGDARAGIPGRAELTYSEMCDLLDQLVDEGCLWLLITGGEPLLRSDFLDIYTYAKQKGLLITLFTNGTLITREIADHLREWPPFKVEISLYGRTRETYEKVTGVPGSYESCLCGIELLLERGLPLNLKTMIMTLNKHEVWDIKKYAEGLGVDFRFDPLINAGLDGDQELAELRIAPEEIVELDLADARRLDKWRDFCDRFLGVAFDRRYVFFCGAGIHTFHIDPHGELSVCILYRAESYDLRLGSFREGWHDFIPQVRNQKARNGNACSECDLIVMCGQCPGWAQLEHGDSQTPIQYLCQVAHLRAQALGLVGEGMQLDMRRRH